MHRSRVRRRAEAREIHEVRPAPRRARIGVVVRPRDLVVPDDVRAIERDIVARRERAAGAARAASGAGVGSAPTPMSGNWMSGQAGDVGWAVVTQLASTAAVKTSAPHPERRPLIAPSERRLPIRVATSRVARSYRMAKRYQLVIAIAMLVACAPVQRASVPTSGSAQLTPPNDPPLRSQTHSDPLRCTDRATIPALDNVFEAEWSPDSRTLALSKITTIPSDRTITGTKEDQPRVLVEPATGASVEPRVSSDD